MGNVFTNPLVASNQQLHVKVKTSAVTKFFNSTCDEVLGRTHHNKKNSSRTRMTFCSQSMVKNFVVQELRTLFGLVFTCIVPLELCALILNDTS
jgi:hypothetical protein